MLRYASAVVFREASEYLHKPWRQTHESSLVFCRVTKNTFCRTDIVAEDVPAPDAREAPSPPKDDGSTAVSAEVAGIGDELLEANDRDAEIVLDELVREHADETPLPGAAEGRTALEAAGLAEEPSTETSPESPGAAPGVHGVSRSEGSTSAPERADQIDPLTQEARPLRRSRRRSIVALATSSSPLVGAGSCDGQEGIHPLPETRPPRRSGRRRSIAPRMVSLAAAEAEAEAAEEAAAAETAPERSSLVGAASSDDDFSLLLPEGPPPPRSKRRQSVAVRRRPRPSAAGPPPPPPPLPPAAGCADEAVAEATPVTVPAALSPVPPRGSASSEDKGPDVVGQDAAEAAPLQEKGADAPHEQEKPTKRRSQRRKSLRLARAGGSLLEGASQAEALAPSAEEPAPSAKAGDGDGERSDEGMPNVTTGGTAEKEEGAQGGAAVAVGRGQAQAAVLADLLNKVSLSGNS